MLFGILACEKDGDLGEDLITLQDSEINVAFTDTISIYAYSEIVDSVSTSNLRQNLLGSHLDAVFGTTTASIYTQLRLSQNDVDFGSNPVCDSIILTLDYADFYGDSSVVQTINVHEISEDMYFDSTYFSNDTLDVFTTPIGSYTGGFAPNDSSLYDGTIAAPHLRIPLETSFADKILAKSGMTELSDNDNFLDFMKGIFITAQKSTQSGGFAYFDLTSSLSGVTLYYHNDSDTLNYKLSINESCSYFSAFNHYNYMEASTDLQFQINKMDTMLGMQNLYVQSLGGIKTRFYFPFLKDLSKDGPIAVQNAELLINVKSGSDQDYEPLFGLAVVKLDSTGKPQFIDDYFEGSSYFGGDFNEINKQYSFNLNRYIQSILQGNQKEYGLEIIAKGASIYGNRLIFAGPESNDRPFRLKLTYTKVN
jgi:hypothetical protein